MSAHPGVGLQETLEFHWGKHHRSYVTNLNAQIKDKPLANKTLEEVIELLRSDGTSSSLEHYAPATAMHAMRISKAC